MILDRIRHFFEPTHDEIERTLMNERLLMNQIHEDWKARAFPEAEKRFLVLSPLDSSETHWKLVNQRGDTVFPTNKWGATRNEISGFFESHPQA